MLAAIFVFGAAVFSGEAHAQSTSTTTTTSSLNPSQYSQSVTFAATIAGNGNGAPTGAVQFMDGASALGSAVTVNTLGVGHALAAGQNHACALTAAGGVKCWGIDYYGELGVAAEAGNQAPNLPAGVSGLGSGVVAIATGSFHTCALTLAGGAKCWGDNGFGQLGVTATSGSNNPNPDPVDVSGLTSGLVAIAAGYGHTCALTAAGGVKCWGVNEYGELGVADNSGTLNPNPTPVDVSGLTSGVIAIAAATDGEHACALTVGGGVKCWGDNYYGELGNSATAGSSGPNPTPVDVDGLTSGVTAIAAGQYHTCALTAVGGVKCWGYNHYGQLGVTDNNGNDNPNPRPIDVPGLGSGIVAIAGGELHTCALTAVGAVKCWGDNYYGQLGVTDNNGNHNPNPTPIDVPGLGSGVAALALGANYTCVLTAAGGVECLGNNEGGQLGVATNAGENDPNPTPLDVTDFGAGSALVFGNATLTTTALTAGNHSITAAYTSDNSNVHSASTSDPVSQDVDLASSITSADQTTFTVGQPGSFTMTTTGYPVPALSESGALPSGVTFLDNGNGTATITGVPSAGTGGSYPVTLTASNGVGSDATQIFTLTINQPPAVTSASSTSGTVGSPLTFTVTTTGFPTPALNESGALPSGVSFIDNGDATATLSGTPGTGGGGSFPVTLTVSNGAAPDATQNFTLTIAKGTASVSLSPLPNPAKIGQSVTLTASLSGPAAASGSVTFKDGATTLGSSNVSGVTAVTSTSTLAVGSHSLTALFNGNSDLDAATSSAQQLTVAKGATTVVASALPTTAKPGQAVTLKATIAVTAPAAGNPTGSVAFKDGTRTLGSGTVSSRKAMFSTSALTIGTHAINASYGGDGNLTSSAASATVKVSAAVGTETKVNTTIAGAQQTPAIAALKSGSVIVWASNGEDKSGYGIYMQRFSAAGTKAGAETQANTTTAGAQLMPAVAGLKSGGFIVVWQSANEDKSGLGIYGQIFAANGKPSGKEFKVNTTTKGDQSLPSVASLTSSGFVVAWTSNAQDGSGLGVYAQMYDATGKASGTEFKVNTATAGDQSNPSVAGLTGGGFVIAWQGPDANGLGVYMQRYAATGKAQGNETLVNKTTVSDQSAPSIAPLDTGGYVIAWQSNLGDGSGLGVYMQRFNPAGAKSGSEVRVNTTTVSDQSAPAVSGFSDGGYVVLWQSQNQDGSGWGVYAQAFNDAGKAVNAEFLVNTTTAGDQLQPAVAAFASGAFTAAWTSTSPGAAAQDIATARFAVPGTH